MKSKILKNTRTHLNRGAQKNTVLGPETNTHLYLTHWNSVNWRKNEKHYDMNDNCWVHTCWMLPHRKQSLWNNFVTNWNDCLINCWHDELFHWILTIWNLKNNSRSTHKWLDIDQWRLIVKKLKISDESSEIFLLFVSYQFTNLIRKFKRK